VGIVVLLRLKQTIQRLAQVTMCGNNQATKRKMEKKIRTFGAKGFELGSAMIDGDDEMGVGRGE
jgi:hypothetical protein